MGRWSNSPDEVECLKRITIADLKKLGYLLPNVHLNRNIFWNASNGAKASSITVIIDTNDTDGYITLDYTFNDSQKVNYKVKLITRPSNLGNGLLWFFVCPHTQKVCRKLHLNSGYFLHRTAFNGLYYEKQLQSKKWRDFEKVFGSYLDEKLYEQLYKKHFKKFYNGKPTKRYVQLMKKINARKDINFEDWERALLM